MKTMSDGDRIVIPIARTADWTYVVIGSAGLVVMLTAMLIDIQPEPAATQLVKVLEPIVFKAAALMVAYIGGVYGSGAAWRLISPRPQMSATPSQIEFHPSLHRSPIPWRDIKSIEIPDAYPRKLIIRLRSRFWSPTSPLTETKIVIPLMWIWNEEEMQTDLITLRRWHVQASA